MRRLSAILRAGAAILGCASTAALAVPAPGEICTDAHVVDRERLALAALAEANVSPYPYRWAVTHGDASGMTPAQVLLAADNFCGQRPASEGGVPRCGKDDAAKLGDAQNIVISILANRDHDYVVPAGIDSAAALFAAGAPGLGCNPAAQVAAAPKPIPAPFDFKKVPLRLRGSSDGLQFDRNRDAAFNGVEKANFGFKSDDAAGKDTFKAALLLGLSLAPKPGTFELVPYIGFSTDTTKKKGSPKDVSERSWRTGLLFDVRSHGDGVTHLFLLRPEYAWNRKDKSQLLTGAFTYQPLVNGRFNDAINILTDDGRSLLSIIPRGDVRLVGEHFTKRGDRDPADSRDVLRIGGQLGITFTSDVKWLPVELTVTDTYLWAISGDPNHISYLKGVLSAYFDKEKYFGIDLSYARGRRDDLLQRESSWSAGFAAKF